MKQTAMQSVHGDVSPKKQDHFVCPLQLWKAEIDPYGTGIKSRDWSVWYWYQKPRLIRMVLVSKAEIDPHGTGINRKTNK